MQIGNQPDQLLIVPDAFPTQLPFEVLLSAPVNNQKNNAYFGIDKIPYLIKDYSFSHAFS